MSVRVVHYRTCRRDVSVRRGRWHKVDILADKEAENWKILHFCRRFPVWDYMTEQVKPQHSFSRVRPVLVRGEEVCWALDRGRLAGTPQIQAKEMLKNLLHN